MVYDIALTFIRGLGKRGIIRLLDVFESAESVFNASCEEIERRAELNPQRLAAVIVESRKSVLIAAKREIEYCQRHNITPIVSTDERYPKLMLMSEDYPHVIYVMGDPAALKLKNISVIGTRRMSSYGDRMVFDMVRGLHEKTSDLCIVSGLAYGIDSAAHRAALHFGATTVAVLANPLPSITPTANRHLAREIIENGGALVSEYHSQTKQSAGLFVARNHVVATISEATVVVESPASGGSIITANIASSYDRKVFAVPGRITDTNSEGCNTLIEKNIAEIYLYPNQIVRSLMWDCNEPTDRPLQSTLQVELSPDQIGLLNCFRGRDSLTMDQLAELSQLSINIVSAMLIEMEMLGAVRIHGNVCMPLVVTVV